MRLSRISLIFPLVCAVAICVLAADRAFISYANAKPVLDQDKATAASRAQKP